MLEHLPRQDAVAVERQIPTGDSQLASANVATLGEPRLAVLERRQHEQVSVLVEPPLPQPDLLHDPISERQLRHRLPRSVKIAGPPRRRRSGGVGRAAPCGDDE